jgi:hypothetical protein
MNRDHIEPRRATPNKHRRNVVSKRDRKNGVPDTVTSIPLVDPHALSDNPSIGELVRDATAQMSTLVRAEVELAKSEITRDVKKGLTGSVFFIAAGVVLLYSTFFFFFFLAELLDTWLWRWAAFLIVFLLMVAATALFGFLGYRKVRRIRGPQQTIESVKETTAALTPGLQKFAGGGHSTPAVEAAPVTPAVAPAPRPAVTSAPRPAPRPPAAPVVKAPVVEVAEVTEVTEVTDEPAAQYDTTSYAVDTVYDTPQAYSAETVTYEPAVYGDDAVVYTDETVVDAETAVVYSGVTEYSDQRTGPIPVIRTDDPDPADDPTAAIYADTGLPVTPEHEHGHDHRRGDPSGW